MPIPLLGIVGAGLVAMVGVVGVGVAALGAAAGAMAFGLFTAAVGIIPWLGPFAGGLFATFQGGALVAGGTMAVLQGFCMSWVAPALFSGCGVVISVLGWLMSLGF